jgi:hypothetical protein
MTTFTFRAPNQLAANLRSAEMRSWLDDFVRQPHALPIDPGSGGGRISLTLPESTVKSVAAYCQCGISSALRRIAFEKLESRMTGPGYDGSPAILHRTGSAANIIPCFVDERGSLDFSSKRAARKGKASAAEVGLILRNSLFLARRLSNGLDALVAFVAKPT